LNNHKANNSILVLATLGVYLGLVLVVSMQQVIAQETMTKQFNVKDEVEATDGLDKKPIGLSPSTKRNEDLFGNAVSELIQNLYRLDQGKKFSSNETRHLAVTDFSYYESDNTPSFLESGPISKHASKVFVEAAVKISESFFRKAPDLGVDDYLGGWPNGVSVDLKTDPDWLSLNIKFPTKSDVAANLLFGEIDLNRLRTNSNSSLKTYLLDNTRVSCENNQVFIVTRLPRAGLDSLLAGVAK
jgi:hypothetical protein